MDLEKSLKLANKNGQKNQEMAVESSSEDIDDYDEEREDFGIDMDAEEGEDDYDMEDDDSADEELMKKIESHGKNKQG